MVYKILNKLYLRLFPKEIKYTELLRYVPPPPPINNAPK